MTLVVKSRECRLCGRTLKDKSDLWAGRCNNDDACIERRNTKSKNIYLRDALNDIREWSKPEHVLSFDDGDISLADFITDALEQNKLYDRSYTAIVANDIPKLIDEIERYRRALAHIADTCIQDPDTAQFAARVLDGSADVEEP